MSELSILERFAHWLESQGASVKSTHFSYSGGEATISAVIDREKTEVREPDGVKELRDLLLSSETALRIDQRLMPSTLEVIAKNMARSVMKLRRIARGRGPDYFFDLFASLERECRAGGLETDDGETKDGGEAPNPEGLDEKKG